VKLTCKKIKKLEKEGKLRDNLEIWIDKHNHKMELLRTINSIVNIVLSSIIFLRVFGII
jgi:hypothetical protein